MCFTSYCSSSPQLQAYALGEMSKGEHLDYSQQGCTADVAIISLRVASSDVHVYFTIGVIGFIFVVIFNVMASVAFVQVLLKTLLQKMEVYNYSFDYYGMFWGISAILYPVLILLLFVDIALVCYIIINPDVGQSGNVRYIWPFVLAFPIILCAPVAIYFGVKFNLPTPSVYLLPAKLLCCCNEKRARALVLSLTLWFDLVAANFIISHVVFVVLAFLVAPFAVAVNVMLLVLSVMCLTYIMALVFTVCASIGARRLRTSNNFIATVRAAMLIPLLLAVICFSVLLAFSGQFVNTATQQNSFLILLKSLITPVLLAVVSVSLKKFIFSWVHWSLGGVQDCEEMNQLPRHGCNRYQVMDNAVVDNVH